MLDKILVFIAIVALIAFCGVVVGFVAEPDLIITIALILALATHDFWITVFKNEQASKLDTSGALESLPTGVSGKPLQAPETATTVKTRRKPKPAAKARTAAKAKTTAATASKRKTAKTGTKTKSSTRRTARSKGGSARKTKS